MEEEQSSNNITKRYKLGPLGHLIAITPAVAADQAGAEETKGHFTLILDVSGSMGAWVGYSRKAAQAAMIQLGYDEKDEFSFITFTGSSKREMVSGRDPTIGELTTRLNHIKCQGATNMSGVIPLLGDVLRSHPESAHNVLVISDGQVHDQDRTVRMATDMVNSLGECNAPISASLLRLLTSYGASPDTRALASVGSFCNQSKAAVTDVNVSNSIQEEVGILNLTESIVTGFRDAATGTFVELVAEEPIFRRLPTSEGMTTVRVPCTGATTYLLVSEPLETVTLGGEVITVEDAGPLDSEATLATFFEFVEQQLKMWQLMGTRQSDIQRVVDWVGELQSFLDTVQTKATEEADLSTMARARSVAKAIKKRTGSILDRIRQLGNADRVGQLNAQQQADWLRGIGNTRTGRGLARRAQRANEDLDYAGQAQSAVRLLGEQNFPKEENTDAPRSFYSLSDPMDCLKSAGELVEVVNDLTVGDILQCVGGVGVPIEAFVGDYPDPFSLRVKRVYDGQSLAEPDVWLVRAQTGRSDAVLKCPGRGDDANITGVIVLRSADPEAYRRYTSGDVRRIFELQASSQIRHVVASVPYDAIALSAAGAWHLIQTLGFQRNLSTVQWETLRSLLDNINFLIGKVYKKAPFRELYDSMTKNEDVRGWLTGDRDVSGILRPITVLLRFFEAPDDERVEWLPHVLRALYYLDCYHAAKKHFRREDDSREARERLLTLTLGIDMEKNGTPLRPLFEEEPENPDHFDAVTVGDLQIPQFFPRVGGLIGLEAVLRNRLITIDPITVFGVNPNTLRAVASVQALRSPNQSDRIDTDNRTCLLPDPTTEEEAQAYLRDVVRSYYAEDYDKRLAAKKRKEERIKLMEAIDALQSAEDYDIFRALLLECPIVNRQHEGYALLMERFLDTENEVPCRMEKLSLLMTGRNLDKPEVEVWSNGNFFTGNWAPIAQVIQSLPGGEERMVLLRKLRKQYGIHRYRGGDDHIPNQHGHGNDFPSYWALGYKDLYDMKASVPHEEFVAYLQAHCVAKGCCLPNETQRADFGL